MANQALTALYEALLESYPTPGPPMVTAALKALGAEIERLEAASASVESYKARAIQRALDVEHIAFDPRQGDLAEAVRRLVTAVSESDQPNRST